MHNYFTDSATLTVFGVQAVLERLRPDSERGRILAKTSSPWGPTDRDDWLEELDRRRETERWASDDARLKQVRDALAYAPPLERVVAQLRGDEVLEQPELFAAKRLLWAAHQTFTSAGNLLHRWGADPGTPGRVGELLDGLHPEKTPSRRFKLAGDLQPGLHVARSAARAARKTTTEIRKEAEEAVIASSGGRFDIRGWYLPESNSFDGHDQLDLVDGRWTLSSPTLEQARAELADAQQNVARLEMELCARLSDLLRASVDFLDELAERLAVFDLRLAAVRLRQSFDGCWPEAGHALEIEGGRDPALVARLGDDVQPIDVTIEAGATVVTGPNMGGKSALCRLVGLVQWLAQHALPVPADVARMPMFEHLVYIGSEEGSGVDTEEGLSSFGREVHRVVAWRGRRRGPTLWLLDEFGRGTHPDDGAALAADLVEMLVSEGDCVVAATHFPAVANLRKSTHLRIRGLVGASTLKEVLGAARDPGELRDALQRAMDYRPAVVDDLDVPRDARLVARALGLELGEDDNE